MRWTALHVDGDAEHLGEREAHMACALLPRAAPRTADHAASTPSAPCFVLVIGGFKEGEHVENAVAFPWCPRRMQPLGAWSSVGKDERLAREGASLAAAGDLSHALLFGGLHCADYELRNDLLRLELSFGPFVGDDHGCVTGVAAAAFAPRLLVTDLAALQCGDVPTPRAHHAAAMLRLASTSSEAMVVFGGESEFGLCNDLFLLDCGSLLWRAVACASGTAPRPRMLSALAPVGRSVASGASPTASSLGPSTVVVVYGGAAADAASGDRCSLGDAHWIDLEAATPEWLPCSSGSGALPRVNGHCAASVGGCAVFVSGKDRVAGFDGAVVVELAGGNTTAPRAMTIPPEQLGAGPPAPQAGIDDQVSLEDVEFEHEQFVTRSRLRGVPHWRYMAAICRAGTVISSSSSSSGEPSAPWILLGGQCRHNDAAAFSFILSDASAFL